MGVSTFIELYLTYYSWGFYNVLWELLLHFGIIFIPFGYILFESFTKKSEVNGGKKTSKQVLNELKIKIILAMIVLWVAALPIMPLAYADLSYTSMMCNDTTRTITQVNGGGATGTTYDNSFGVTVGAFTTRVPLWWWAVLNISQAISDGTKVRIPCKTSLVNIRYDVASNKITNLETRQEMADFIHHCYKPSVAKFAKLNPSTYDAVPALRNKNDIGWIGSTYLLSTAGYYDFYRASRPITGVPYDGGVGGREQSEATPGYESANGRPTCKEWYNGVGTHPGLRSKILNGIPVTTRNNAVQGLGTLAGFSTTNGEDALIRQLTKINYSNILPSTRADDAGAEFHIGAIVDGSSLNEGNAGMIDGATLGYIGGIVGKVFFVPTLYMLKEALPIVQAFILFGIIFLLPFLLIISNYGVQALLTVTALVVSIKFWPAIWEVGKFFESNLFQAFTSNTEFWEFIDGNGPTGIVLSFVIGAWYLLGPMLLSTLMGIAGYQAGSAVQGAMSNGVKESQSAGKQGASAASKGVSAVANRAGGKK